MPEVGGPRSNSLHSMLRMFDRASGDRWSGEYQTADDPGQIRYADPVGISGWASRGQGLPGPNSYGSNGENAAFTPMILLDGISDHGKMTIVTIERNRHHGGVLSWRTSYRSRSSSRTL